jgi:hypothetical protein
MVPLTTPNSDLITLRYDQLTKSVDSAIRDLLAAGSDPVSLACYLWVCRRHNLQLINSAGLANWGVWWVQHILIDRNWGKKRDDDIASAVLAASVMHDASSLRDLSDTVRAAATELMATERNRHVIPFNHQGPGSMTLLGAAELNLNDVRLPSSIAEVVEAFERSASSGRVFGITFAVLAYRRTVEEGDLSPLVARIKGAIDDPETDYEDRIYFTQALCYTTPDGRPDETSFRHIDVVMTDSPVWAYLMSGQEDIPSAGDGNATVLVSHLCRAALLDLLLHYQAHARERMEAKIDERYRGRRGVGIPAFGFYALGFAAIWFILLRILIRDAGIAWRYLFVHDYGSISWISVVIYQFAFVTAAPLIPITFVTLVTCWSYLVKSPVESDQRIREVLWQKNERYLRIWFGLFVLNVGLNIYAGLINPAIQHMIDRK